MHQGIKQDLFIIVTLHIQGLLLGLLINQLKAWKLSHNLLLNICKLPKKSLFVLEINGKAGSKPKHYISALCCQSSGNLKQILLKTTVFLCENQLVAKNALWMLNVPLMRGTIRICKIYVTVQWLLTFNYLLCNKLITII